jgi:hypothetical protein
MTGSGFREWMYANESSIEDRSSWSGPHVGVSTVLVGILEDWYKIHPGNAKSDLLKYFELDGGFWGPDKQTYISRRCPYIKIDVTFRVDPHTDSGSVITSVSRPYLDSPHAD